MIAWRLWGYGEVLEDTAHRPCSEVIGEENGGPPTTAVRVQGRESMEGRRMGERGLRCVCLDLAKFPKISRFILVHMNTKGHVRDEQQERT